MSNKLGLLNFLVAGAQQVLVGLGSRYLTYNIPLQTQSRWIAYIKSLYPLPLFRHVSFQ